MSHALRYLSVSVRTLLLMTLVLGVAYPLGVWGVGQVAFRPQANGSMVQHNGQTVGSSLIGQNFDGPEWFHSRPSAAGDGYDAMSSGASNLGPTSQKLLSLVEQAQACRRPRRTGSIPIGSHPRHSPPAAVASTRTSLLSTRRCRWIVWRKPVGSTPIRFAPWWTRLPRAAYSAFSVSPG